MKKRVVLIVGILLTIQLVSATTQYKAGGFVYSPYYESFECSETDDGSDFYSKGTLTVYVGEEEKKHTDRCKDFRYLLEYACNNRPNYNPLMVYCNNGCKDGACLNLASYKKVSPFKESRASSIGRHEARYPQPQPGIPAYIRRPEYSSPYYTTDVYCKGSPASGDPFTRGSIEIIYPDGRTNKYTDFCWSSTTVKEYSCEYSNPSQPQYIFCNGRCIDGACQSWKVYHAS
ncbi:MAG: hypothetical protein QW331_02855 [Candidatus Woesearchaeota archaeon]